MCHASTREGSKCKKSIDCPMDHFCNSKNRCTKALEPGQNCKREYECGRAHSCLKLVEHGDENICIPNNYLEDGVLFAFADTGFFNEENDPSHLMKEEDTSFLDGGKITPTLSLYCESVNHVQLGKNLFQCRKADKNMKTHLSRKLPAKNCLIETYSDVNPKNFDMKKNYTEESLCGFNKDSRAWCPLKLGDKLAQKYYRNWSEKMKSLKCSKFSKNDPESGSVCYEYHKAIEEKDEDLFSYNKLQATVISEGSAQVWANTANNNRCVAETLTFDFWNGHYGSFDDSFH
uniref:Uncharacterized protein n=1 Tax=Euplotes crassus TaxID=5936 RepID=A0A7S3P1J1_EUPCR